MYNNFFITYNGKKILYLFVYDSICIDSASKIFENPCIQTHLSTIKGWKCSWCVRSQIYSGRPSFEGLMVMLIRSYDRITQGVLYIIPHGLIYKVIKELDYFKKEEYTYEELSIFITKSQKKLQALVFREAEESPSYWKRALFDDSFASVVISRAIGSFVTNLCYCRNLSNTLKNDGHTKKLHELAKHYKSNKYVYFMFGCGSNEYNQLLLKDYLNKDLRENISTKSGEEEPTQDDCVDHLLEILLVVPKQDITISKVISLYCGGSHCAVVTSTSVCYTWGNNSNGQLGICLLPSKSIYQLPIPIKSISLGHDHSLFISTSNKLYTCGNNINGRVNGNLQVKYQRKIIIPEFAANLNIKSISSGPFHSAILTYNGIVHTFGQYKKTGSIHQIHSCLHIFNQIVCGKNCTVATDINNRVWTMGCNTYGALGRNISSITKTSPHYDPSFQIISHSILSMRSKDSITLQCGYSHFFVIIYSTKNVYMWGRNDMGQLGSKSTRDPIIFTPIKFYVPDYISSFKSINCGAESTIMVDMNYQLWGSGWNDHGNLASGDRFTKHQWTKVNQCNIITKSLKGKCSNVDEVKELLVGVGGAFFISMWK